MTLTQRRPPAATSKPTLVSQTLSASSPSSVRIGHVQLRDLILCPAERGVLWYVGDKRIIEQDILSKRPSKQYTLATLSFTPVTIAALQVCPASSSGRSIILLAAGGQDAELFLAAYQYTPRKKRPRGKSPVLTSQSDSEDEELEGTYISERTSMLWHHMSTLIGSINNNVLLYLPPHSLNFDVDMESARNMMEPTNPRLVVSNNDCTVKFYDVSLAQKGFRCEPFQPSTQAAHDARYWRREYARSREGEGWSECGGGRILRFERVGCLRLPVPVNHTSISPDGSTVLACGDASTIYLFRILPNRDGNALIFEPLANYAIPVPTSPPRPPPASMRPIRGSTGSSIPSSSTLDSPENSAQSPYLPYAFVDGAWVLAVSHPHYAGVAGADAPPACFATAWSSDGTRFAAAGQEGAVRVWDVRSQNPLQGASWETVPNVNDSEASSMVGAWYDRPGAAPPWGIRALKFAKNASGRELLVFTEHVSKVHIIDADTFSVHDVVRVPHVRLASGSSGRAAEQRAAHMAVSDANFPGPRSRPFTMPIAPDPGSTPRPFNARPRQFLRRSDDALMPPASNALQVPRRVLDNEAPFSRSPEALDDGDRMSAQQRWRLDMLRDHRELERAADANAPASALLRRMARHYQRFLDDTVPNPSPAQEEDMRARARAALNLLRESEEAGRQARDVESTERDTAMDRLPGRSSPEISNLSSRSILHALMMRSMRMSSDTNTTSPPSTSTAASLQARDGNETSSVFTRPARPPRFFMPTSVDTSDLADFGFEIDAPGPSNPPIRPQRHSSVRTNDESLSFFPPERPSITVQSTMENDADCPPEQMHSPPPPVSAGVASQSSFASMSSVNESTQNRAPWADGNGSDSLPPGLMSASSSEDEMDDEDDSWTGSSMSLVNESGPSSTRRDVNLESSLVVPQSPTSSSTSHNPNSVPFPPITNSTTISEPLSAPAAPSTSETLPPCRELIEQIDALDIAGVCFDPTGAYMYVATTEGITEWAVQGSSQRWWSSSGYM